MECKIPVSLRCSLCGHLLSDPVVAPCCAREAACRKCAISRIAKTDNKCWVKECDLGEAVGDEDLVAHVGLDQEAKDFARGISRQDFSDENLRDHFEGEEDEEEEAEVKPCVSKVKQELQQEDEERSQKDIKRIKCERFSPTSSSSEVAAAVVPASNTGEEEEEAGSLNRRFYFGKKSSRDDDLIMLDSTAGSSPNSQFWKSRSPTAVTITRPKATRKAPEATATSATKSAEQLRPESLHREEPRKKCCLLCRSEGHRTKMCPTLKDSICKECGVKGHQVFQCPERRKSRKKGSSGRHSAGTSSSGRDSASSSTASGVADDARSSASTATTTQRSRSPSVSSNRSSDHFATPPPHFQPPLPAPGPVCRCVHRDPAAPCRRCPVFRLVAAEEFVCDLSHSDNMCEYFALGVHIVGEGLDEAYFGSMNLFVRTFPCRDDEPIVPRGGFERVHPGYAFAATMVYDRRKLLHPWKFISVTPGRTVGLCQAVEATAPPVTADLRATHESTFVSATAKLCKPETAFVARGAGQACIFRLGPNSGFVDRDLVYLSQFALDRPHLEQVVVADDKLFVFRDDESLMVGATLVNPHTSGTRNMTALGLPFEMKVRVTLIRRRKEDRPL